MAEIDRIKALAGLLDDRDCDGDGDDHLFPSEAMRAEQFQWIGENSAGRSPSTRKAVGVGAGGAVPAEAEGEATRPLDPIDDPRADGRPFPSPDDSSLGRSSSEEDAGVAVDVGGSGAEAEGRGHLVFGRPKTFGAAGGFSNDYMPNVKERAVAVSAWKIIEMKKERRSGRARAAEWSCVGDPPAAGQRGASGRCGQCGQYDYDGDNDENVPKNAQIHRSARAGKKSVPSFLAHFDSDNHNYSAQDQNTQNSVNGLILSPRPGTPRNNNNGGGNSTRLPLSPRGGEPLNSTFRVSPRNIRVGPKAKNYSANENTGAPSPRNTAGASPRSVLGPRNALSFGTSKSPSPRNPFRKSSDEAPSPPNTFVEPSIVAGYRGDGPQAISSPRSKSLLAPSKAAATAGRHFDRGVERAGSIPARETPARRATRADAPSGGRFDEGPSEGGGTESVAERADAEARRPPGAEVAGSAPSSSVIKVAECGGGELAAALERRFAKIRAEAGEPSSIVDDGEDEENDGCDGNNMATSNDDGAELEFVSEVGERKENCRDGNKVTTYNNDGAKPDLVYVVKETEENGWVGNKVNTPNDGAKPELVSAVKDTKYSPAKVQNAPSSRCTPSFVADKKTKPSSLEEAFHKVVGFKAGTKPPVDKTIDDTLEEASRFLKSTQHLRGSPNNNRADSIEADIGSKCDEELLSAAELARALDKLLVDSDSSVGDDVSVAEEASVRDVSAGTVAVGYAEVAGVAIEEASAAAAAAEIVMRGASMESDGVNEDTNKVRDKTEETNEVRDGNESVGESPKTHHEPESTVQLSNSSGHGENQELTPESSEPGEAKGWDEWNLSTRDGTQHDQAFSTDFSNLTNSQFDADFAASSDDNSFFHVAFVDDAVPQFVPPDKPLPPQTRRAAGQRKLPKIKIAIDGAPTFQVDEHRINTDSPLFFFSQSSPSCGDSAGLLQSQSGIPNEEGSRVKTRTHLAQLNNPTIKLNLKGLLNHTLPSKHDRARDGQSPSATGLLAISNDAASMEMDENVGFVNVQNLANLPPKNDQTEHFFFGAVSSPTSKDEHSHPHAKAGSDKKKKKSNIFHRITSPLLNGRKLGRMGFNDDASFGRL